MSTETERPAWLDPKFKTVEDLAKSYTHLEKLVGRKGYEQGEQRKGSSFEPEQKPEPRTVTEEPPPTPDPETDPDGSGLQIEAGEPIEETPAVPAVDPRERYRTAVQRATAGQMDTETLEVLADLGVSPQDLAKIQQGTAARQQLEAQRFEAEALEGIEGGRDAFNEATAWAADNLTPAEQASFNKATSLGDSGVARLAIEALINRHLRSDGPRLVSGQRITGDLGDVFTSRQQIQAAQSDKRYSEDPAFRAEVEAKIIRSDFSKLKF